MEILYLRKVPSGVSNVSSAAVLPLINTISSHSTNNNYIHQRNRNKKSRRRNYENFEHVPSSNSIQSQVQVAAELILRQSVSVRSWKRSPASSLLEARNLLAKIKVNPIPIILVDLNAKPLIKSH